MVKGTFLNKLRLLAIGSRKRYGGKSKKEYECKEEGQNEEDIESIDLVKVTCRLQK